MGGIASIFTPQNTYSASAGVNNGNQDLAGLLAGTQAQTAAIQSNQNSLGAQLLAQSQGTGPNPAQQQLQQALNQNQQNAAGQIASQKGINPGLAQKQIETTSANQAQQAAGQGALMGAQQQIAATNQLGSLYNNQASQNLSNQGQYESTLNSENSTNAGVSAQNAAANQNTTGGLLQGAGAAAMFLNKGGMVPKVQHLFGGTLDFPAPQTNAAPGDNYLGMDVGAPAPPNFSYGISSGMPTLDGSASSPQSLGDSLSTWGNGLSSGMDPLSGGSSANYAGAAGALVGGMGGGGNGASSGIANQLAGGEPHWAAGNGKKNSSGIDPSQVASMAAMFAAHGGQVGGKAPVPGDSPKNDIVPAVLSAKEIVLPRTVTMSDDPGQAAMDFVNQLKGKSNKKGSGYAGVLAAKRGA